MSEEPWNREQSNGPHAIPMDVVPHKFGSQ
jgi:hypothetical protein